MSMGAELFYVHGSAKHEVRNFGGNLRQNREDKHKLAVFPISLRQSDLYRKKRDLMFYFMFRRHEEHCITLNDQQLQIV